MRPPLFILFFFPRPKSLAKPRLFQRIMLPPGMAVFSSALVKTVRGVFLVTAMKYLQGGKKERDGFPSCSTAAIAMPLPVVLGLPVDDLHDDPCAEDESVAEAVVGHRADQLIVDVDELEQVLLRFAAEQLPEPLLVLTERFEQDTDIGVGRVAMLVGTQLAVVEVREDVVHSSASPQIDMKQ